MHSFPSDLTHTVQNVWDTYVDDDSIGCIMLPSEPQLCALLETAYLASMEHEEGRSLEFMLCCTPQRDVVCRYNQERDVDAWAFATDRPFTIQELRRLAVTTEIDTSAIWVRFAEDPQQPLEIHGLLNLGSSWANAQNTFSFHYDALPAALLVRVEAPGYLVVYQGSYPIASLRSGRVTSENPLSTGDLLGAYPLFREGQKLLRREITPPQHESVRDWDQIEWMAYVNTILAIVNSIQLGRHGGALIVAGKNCTFSHNEQELIRIKYALGSGSDLLRQHYITFMNLRHQYGDMVIQMESDLPVETQFGLELVEDAQRRLAETCTFVGDFAATDGALIMRTDLTVEGFGSEILLERVRRSRVYEVKDTFRRDRQLFDSEQHGTRHRSALRLCAACPDLVIFVVSQDGGVSLIWNDKGDACIKTGIRTTSVYLSQSIVVPMDIV